MATKNNPGEFDCHAAADPDEPLFTLLARDRFAPHMVRMWAAARAGDIFGAVSVFNAVANEMLGETPNDMGDAQISEAEKCADDMTDWRAVNRGR